MVIGDGDVMTAVAGVATTATGAMGWLVRSLWSSRDGAQAQLVEMLKLQYADAANRKDLWDKLTQSNLDLVREIKDLEKTVSDMKDDVREALQRKVQ